MLPHLRYVRDSEREHRRQRKHERYSEHHDDRSTSCEDTERVLYTVRSGDNTFVLTPDRETGAKAGALLSMGWSTAFSKNSVLANRLPGTVLLLRGDGKHYFVKIGNRESMYAAVAVR